MERQTTSPARTSIVSSLADANQVWHHVWMLAMPFVEAKLSSVLSSSSVACSKTLRTSSKPLRRARSSGVRPRRVFTLRRAPRSSKALTIAGLFCEIATCNGYPAHYVAKSSNRHGCYSVCPESETRGCCNSHASAKIRVRPHECWASLMCMKPLACKKVFAIILSL